MMKLINDTHEVYRSNTDEPLSFGKLVFYVVGTSTLKSVYADSALTIELPNPMILDQDGRSNWPIFCGVGDYTVHAYQFNGTDHLTAPDTDWSFDHMWYNEGLSASTTDSNEVLYVDTIEQLRAVDQSQFDTMGVRGYYAHGDMFTRVYQLVLSTDNDNGGTVIKNPSISGYSWVYKPENGICDARVFGIIAGGTASLNSQMQLADNWCATNGYTLHYTAGVYTVTGGTVQANANTSIDVGFSLKNTGLTIFTFQIIGELDCRMNGALKNVLSSSNCVFAIYSGSTTKKVNPKWWGCVMNGTADDGDSFALCNSLIANNNCRIYIDNPIAVKTLTNDMTIFCDLEFDFNGAFYSDLTTKKITFIDVEIFYARNYGYGAPNLNVFNVNRMKLITFNNIKEIRSSFFHDKNATGATQDLSKIFPDVICTEGTNFIFDMPISLFHTELTYVNCKNWNFIHESGFIQNNASMSVRISNLDASIGTQCFATVTNPIIIQNGTQHLSWWIGKNQVPSNKSDAYKSALTSCVLGSGSLDCDGLFGYRDALNQFIDDSYAGTEGHNPNIHIYNGGCTVTYSGAYALDFHDMNFDSIKIEKFDSFPSGVGGFLKIDNCAVQKINVEDCRLVSPTRAGSFFLRVESDAGLSIFYMNRTIARCEDLFSVSGFISTSLISDNANIECSVDIRNINSIFTNNRVIGFTGCVIKMNSSSNIPITGNSFYDSYVQICSDSNNIICGSISKNNFISSLVQLSGIVIYGSSATISSLLIEGNIFNGLASYPIPVITSLGTFVNNIGLKICNNTSTNTDLIVLETRATFSYTYAFGDSTLYLPLNAIDKLFFIAGLDTTVVSCQIDYITEILGAYNRDEKVLSSNSFVLEVHTSSSSTRMGNVFATVHIAGDR